MYSDMSSRTIARSSSNRNSASARAVSVLPTPVGPRKMNEPVGRLGSCSPARLRRTALATAATASRWPTTRWPSSSSSLSSRSRSDLEHLGHRNAGPLGHDLGDVLGVHLFLEILAPCSGPPAAASRRPPAGARARGCGRSGARPRAAGRPAGWPGRPRRAAPRSRPSSAGSRWMAPFSACHCAFIAVGALALLGDLLLERLAPLDRRPCPSP